MSIFENFFTTSAQKTRFTLNNLDKSMVNAFRRIILSELITIKFKSEPYDESTIHINKNSCSLHNEFLAHRIGMIPIYVENIEDFDCSKYKFVLKKKCETNTTLNVTTKDFKVYYLDQDREIEIKSGADEFFKPDDITNKHILICKLKPDNTGRNDGEEIDIVAYPTKGCGKENATYSPVSKAVFFNSVNEKLAKEEIDKIIKEKVFIDQSEKNKFIQNYNNLEKYRHFYTNNKGEPNKFNFEIESIGQIPAEIIFRKSILFLKNKINNFNRSLQNNEDNIEIINTPTVMDGLDIIIHNEDHTLGNLLQSYLFIYFVDIEPAPLKFVGYKCPHPLIKKFILRIQPLNPIDDNQEKIDFVKNIINKCIQKLNTTLDNIAEQWRKHTSSTPNHIIKQHIIPKSILDHEPHDEQINIFASSDDNSEITESSEDVGHFESSDDDSDDDDSS